MDLFNLEEKYFYELSKYLERDDAEKAAKDLAVFYVEQQNEDLKSFIKANEVLRDHVKSKSRDSVEIWDQACYSMLTVITNRYQDRINKNNEELIKTLKRK